MMLLLVPVPALSAAAALTAAPGVGGMMPPHVSTDGTRCDLSTLNASVGADGMVVLALCGDRYTLESNFSYTGMRAGAWNTFGPSAAGEAGWRREVQQLHHGNGSTTLVVTGRAAEYTIERRIAAAVPAAEPPGFQAPQARPRLLVEDTFTNLLPSTPLGLAFVNRITTTAPSTRAECQPCQWNRHYANLLSPCIHIGGLRRETGVSFGNAYTATNLAWNPSIFIEGQAGTGGLGLAAVDERFRLQLDMSGAANFSVRLDNKGFGLPARSSYTYHWAIYPTATRDSGPDGDQRSGYWEFINRLRAVRTKRNRTVSAAARQPSTNQQAD